MTLAATCALLAVPARGVGQDVPPTVDTLPPDTTVSVRVERVTPRGAMLRSLVLPGWGQAASGAYSRTVFYAIADIASATMTVKSQRFLVSAREGLALYEADAERRAAEANLAPDSALAFIDADPRVEEARNLVESRTQQREDWIAFGLFMVLLGGVDAFVSAHLADFPEPLTVGTLPAQDGGPPAIEIGVRVPVSWGFGGSHSQSRISGPRPGTSTAYVFR